MIHCILVRVVNNIFYWKHGKLFDYLPNDQGDIDERQAKDDEKKSVLRAYVIPPNPVEDLARPVVLRRQVFVLVSLRSRFLPPSGPSGSSAGCASA